MPLREPASPPHRTNVAQALFLVLSGIIGAAQIGKIIVALPLIQTEMQLSLREVSLFIAVFATLGSLFGLVAGVIGRRIGARPCLIGGMLIIAVASAAGAFAQSAALLLALRIVEGIGFLAVVVVVPDLLSAVVAKKDRDFMFAFWGTFMPTGSALMLLVGPLLPQIGWRVLWLAIAVAAVLYALAVPFVVRRPPPADSAGGEDLRSFLRESGAVLREPACLLLAAAFGLYTFQYFTVAGFLPVLLVSVLHLSLTAASLFTAVALAANAFGNIGAGVLLRLGMPLWLNVLAAFLAFVIAVPLIFAAGLPPVAIAVIAALTLGLGGLLPGSVFAAIPYFVARRGLVAPTVGLVQQTSNLGQFAGPTLTGLVVAQFGWPSAPAALIPAAAIGIGVVFALRRLMAAQRDSVQ